MKQVFFGPVLLSIILCLLPAGTFSESGAEQLFLDTHIIINDVLYAGFSWNQVTSFLPVPARDRLGDVTGFSPSSGYYRTDTFFVYCMASTRENITLSLDFSEGYGKSAQPHVTGLMLATGKDTGTGNPSARPLGIPVRLESYIPVELPLIVKVFDEGKPIISPETVTETKPGKSGAVTIEPNAAGVKTATWCSPGLSLVVNIKDIPSSDMSIVYRTELELRVEAN